MWIGNTEVTKIWLGNTEVTKVWLGDTQIFPVVTVLATDGAWEPALGGDATYDASARFTGATTYELLSYASADPDTTGYTVLTPTGDYTTAYAQNNKTNHVIDASGATFVQSTYPDDPGVKYPVIFDFSNNVVARGGTVNGTTDMTLDWETIYVTNPGNSASVFMKNARNLVTIQDWKVTDAWDAIRVTQEAGQTATFLIDGCWVDNCHDDFMENDDALTGTISNSLVERVFVGLSLGDAGTTGGGLSELVTMENVLMRMTPHLYQTNMVHSSFFKLDTSTAPRISMTNCVLAIEDVNHLRQTNLEYAWDNSIDGGGNYFLNLSDDALPGTYPDRPAGWTTLNGSAARAFWAEKRARFLADWHARRGSISINSGTGLITADTDAIGVEADLPIRVQGSASGSSPAVSTITTTVADPYAAYNDPNGVPAALVADFDAAVYARDTGSGLAAIARDTLTSGFSALVTGGDGVDRIRVNAADEPLIATADFDFSATAGTILAKARLTDVVTNSRVLTLHTDASPAQNRMHIYTSSSLVWRLHIEASDVVTAAINHTTHVDDTVETFVITWDASGAAISVNGATASEDTSITLPTGLSTLRLGSGEGGGDQPGGGIEKVIYWPRKLTNAQIEALSGG